MNANSDPAREMRQRAYEWAKENAADPLCGKWEGREIAAMYVNVCVFIGVVCPDDKAHPELKALESFDSDSLNGAIDQSIDAAFALRDALANMIVMMLDQVN